MRKLNVVTETYDCGDNFRLDIVQDGTYIEGWIYHRCYGVKAMIYGDDCMIAGSKEKCLEDIESQLDYFIDLYTNNVETGNWN